MKQFHRNEYYIYTYAVHVLDCSFTTAALFARRIYDRNR
jgi:hypothetical protein